MILLVVHRYGHRCHQLVAFKASFLSLLFLKIGQNQHTIRRYFYIHFMKDSKRNKLRKIRYLDSFYYSLKFIIKRAFIIHITGTNPIYLFIFYGFHGYTRGVSLSCILKYKQTILWRSRSSSSLGFRLVFFFFKRCGVVGLSLSHFIKFKICPKMKNRVIKVNIQQE